MIKTYLLGVGRTGAVVAEHLLKSAEFELAAVFTKPRSLKVQRKLSELVNSNTNLTIKDTNILATEIKSNRPQVAIDFTNPKAVLKNARVLAEQGINIVIGTTGFNQMQLNELKSIAEQYKIGLVYAPNISIGVNILIIIVKSLAKLLSSYDVEITEYHHRHKKDAPSGTAFKIANAIQDSREVKTPQLVFGRYGTIVRKPNEIGIHAVRAGGIIGVHKVLFSNQFDEIEVTHRSYSRAVFAEGALKAAKFIATKSGFYNMEDLLLFQAEHENNKLQKVSTNIAHWWNYILKNPWLKKTI